MKRVLKLIAPCWVEGEKKFSTFALRSTQSPHGPRISLQMSHTNKSGSRQMEKSRKWESVFSVHVMMCVMCEMCVHLIMSG